MITLLFLFIIEPLLFQGTTQFIIVFAILLFKTASFITQGKEFVCNFKDYLSSYLLYDKAFYVKKFKHSKQIYKN